MQAHISRISHIEAEANRLGIPISDICKKGNVHNSTFQRWKTLVTDAPNMGTWERFTKAYENLKAKKLGLASEGGK